MLNGREEGEGRGSWKGGKEQARNLGEGGRVWRDGGREGLRGRVHDSAWEGVGVGWRAGGRKEEGAQGEWGSGGADQFRRA